jgi:hypothetical protein
MRRQAPTRTARILAAILLLAVVVLVALSQGHHAGGGDPCASGNAPQVCEAQRQIDKEHEAANIAAESEGEE